MRNNVKFKALLLSLGIVLLLGVIGVSGVFAADPPANTTTPADHQKAFLGKVAKILGIDEQKLTDAYKQAQKETHNEQIDKALADGRITQEMADWLKQRPDDGSFGAGMGTGGMMRGGRMGGPMGGRFGGPPPNAPTPAPVQ